MVTQIQLGNLFNQGGKTVLSGGSSGLDIETLIKDLAEAKRQPAVLLEGRIEKNAVKSEALTEMNSLLTSFKDAANFLRNPPGVQNAADNVFEFRSASVASDTTTAGSTFLSVTAEPGSSMAEYEVEITQLATRNVQTTDTFALATADTAAVGGTGPLNAGMLMIGASSIPVTLTAGDTLNQVAAKINAVKSQSGVEATVIQVSAGNYRISFKTTQTGTDQNYDIMTMNPGMFNVGFDIQENAVNASVEFDNTTIVRQTNSIDDIVDGLTFNLLKETATSSTTLTVEIDADRELAKQGILNFIDSYNAFRLFVSKQSETTPRGLPTEDAVLNSNPSMRLAMSRVSAEMSSIVDGITGNDPARLADIGITFSDFPGDAESPFTRNILTVDEDKLSSALSSDFEAVTKVFEFDFTSDDPSLAVFARTNTLGVSNFSLNIDQTGGVFQATYNDPILGATTINLDKEDITGGGIILRGQDGTVLEGLSMIYASSGDSVVDVDITQGIGDRVFNALDTMLDEDTGMVSNALTQVDDENQRYQEEIDRIDEQIERYREQLLNKFSALESALASMNNLLQSLDAQSRAQQNA